ncbi:MAG: hypothetical protein AAGI53_01180 [Planctomycetota bacterium]
MNYFFATAVAVIGVHAQAQSLTETTKLSAPDSEAGDQFGESVGIWGHVGIVGAPGDDWGGLTDAGSVHVFDVTTGESIALLRANDAAPGDLFGTSVAVFDGWVVVGAPADDRAGLIDVGSAYIFDLSTGQQVRIRPSGGRAGDAFGSSVAISSVSVAVGSPFNDHNGADDDRYGSAYVFDRDTGQQRVRLRTSDVRPNDDFGISIALSGSLVYVGASGSGFNILDSGRVFEFDANNGSELRTIVPEFRSRTEAFGASVSVSGDLVVVGAPRSPVGMTNGGRVYQFDVVFDEELDELGGGAPLEFGEFGRSVAVDGELAVVGALTTSTSPLGDVFLYQHVDAALLARLDVSDATDIDLGQSVDIHNEVIIAGAPLGEAAYIYMLDDCDNNTVPDLIDISKGDLSDCNANLLADDCELYQDLSLDCDANGVFDACQISAAGGVDGIGGPLDCDMDGRLDGCDIDEAPTLNGLSVLDFNDNGVLDACELDSMNNCDGDLELDALEIAQAMTLNGLSVIDFNDNGVLDECELDPANDCDGDMQLDAFEIAMGIEPDCNTNGILDSCDLSTADVLDVVVLFDTSGSMDNEAAALCSSVSALDTGLAALNFDAAVTVYGITNAPGGAFSCLQDSVSNAFGASVPNGGTLNSTEDWGEATAVVAERFPWAGDERIIVVVSDEAAQDGDPCDGSDEASVTNAVSIAQQNGVRVIGVAAEGASPCVQGLMSDAAGATGGRWFLSTDPDADLVQGISDAISAVAFSQDCDDDGVPDSCQIDADPSLDCDGNGRLDSCEIAQDASLDCDNMGGLDRCQVPGIVAQNQTVGPLLPSNALSVEVPSAPLASMPVTVRVEITGDFDNQVEVAQLRVNGTLLETFFVGTDDTFGCPDEPFMFEVVIDASTFNSAIGGGGGGNATFELSASPAVDANECPSGSARVDIQYFYEEAPDDCNGNGSPDTCDLQMFGGDSLDDNANFIPDECESVPPCNPADLVAPFGITDLDDIDAFIPLFLVADPAVDFVPPFGVVDLDDLDVFIAEFLAGCL